MENYINKKFLRKYMKRGMSALIVSVILVGCAVALAAFLFISLSGTTRGTLGTVGEWQSSSRLIDFKVTEGACNQDVHEQLGEVNLNTCYSVLIENQMDEDISYIIRTIGSESVVVLETEPFAPYISKYIDVNFDSDVVGTLETVEVIPVSYE